MQVLSILTMERPVSFEAEDIRDEKASSLRVHSFPFPVSRRDSVFRCIGLTNKCLPRII